MNKIDRTFGPFIYPFPFALRDEKRVHKCAKVNKNDPPFGPFLYPSPFALLPCRALSTPGEGPRTARVLLPPVELYTFDSPSRPTPLFASKNSICIPRSVPQRRPASVIFPQKPLICLGAGVMGRVMGGVIPLFICPISRAKIESKTKNRYSSALLAVPK